MSDWYCYFWFTALFSPSTSIFLVAFHFYSNNTGVISKYELPASKHYKLWHLKMYLYKHCLTLFAAKFSVAWAISGSESQCLQEAKVPLHFTWGMK